MMKSIPTTSNHRKTYTIAGALLLAISVFLANVASGASIVKVDYKKDGELIARTIYSGPDGWSGSDIADYWKLLGRPPMFGRDVVIEPDVAGGNTATLEGEIEVSIEIRNKFNMGVAKTDKLKLIRSNEKKADGWHLSKAELKRVMALAKQADPKKKDEPKKGKKAGVKEVLEAGNKAGKLPAGLVVRVHADMWNSSDEASGGEAVYSEKKFKESWEFTTDHIHRMVHEKKENGYRDRRVESRPFDSKNLCGELLLGKAIEIESDDGTGAHTIFAGTPYDFGGRSIEIARNGEELLHLGENCAAGGYAKSNALAFAALYEKLASQARAAFAKDSKPQPTGSN